MRNFLISTIALVAIAFTLTSTSCKKEEDEGKLPNISFKTTSGYTFTNQTVPTDTTLTVGINASKAEEEDVLKTYVAQVFYDGHTAADSTLSTVTLSGSQGDNYSTDTQIHTRSVAGTEKYVFTVINRDGLKNFVSFTLTVQ